MQGQPQQLHIHSIMKKYEKIAISKGIRIQSIEKMDFNQTLKQYSEHIINFGKKGAEKFLQQALQTSIDKVKKGYYNERPIQNLGVSQQLQQSNHRNSIECLQQRESSLYLVVIKEREKQRDDEILNDWKQARCNFDKKRLSNQQDQFQQEGLELIDIQFSKKTKQCLPLQYLLAQKIRNLKVLHIQYTEPQLKIKPSQEEQDYLYSVSPFNFFKVVHQNKQLAKVILKGVHVQNFEQFLKQFRANNEIGNTNIEYSWMLYFSPLQSLTLSIDVFVYFNLDIEEKVLSHLNNLLFFTNKFHSLSDIGVRIVLQRFVNVDSCCLLDKLLKQLRKYMDTIKNTFYLQILAKLGQFYLGDLPYLQKQNTLHSNFSQGAEISDLLSIEEIMHTIFQNNLITHLKLHHCSNFPKVPQKSTFQSINIWAVTFRRNFGLMSELKQKDLVRSVKFEQAQQQWVIEEKIFDQLQTFDIYFCNGLSLANFISRSPSNIKYLKIQNSNIGQPASLLLMFPKLFSLVYLQLSSNVKDYTICSIPSPYVEQLHLWDCGEITDEGLKEIDEKWSQLRKITLWDCSKVSENVWNICKFKKLMEVRFELIQESLNKQLASRGIKINYQ